MVMASAELIFKEGFTLDSIDGKIIVFYMDLYRLPNPYDPTYPEGYKFSWIAYEDNLEESRVLFDCHSPKGPHMHIDADKEGVEFEWTTLIEVRKLFFQTVVKRFGPIPELEGEL